MNKYITKMIKKNSLHFEDLNEGEHNYNEYVWNHGSVLGEKNSNTTVCFSPANNSSFSKKNYNANKTLTSKLHKMPLYQDQNFLKIEQLTTQHKGFTHFKRKSNIQILKKEIQYLQQDTLSSEQFPKNDRLCDFFTKSEEQLNRKKQSHSLKASKGVTKCIKGLRNETVKCSLPHSQQKLKGKWFKSKEKKAMIESVEKQNKQARVFHKYQLVAPYRKYFPASRFRKNRSSTMKVDQILGRRVTKLSNFSLQQQIR